MFKYDTTQKTFVLFHPAMNTVNESRFPNFYYQLAQRLQDLKVKTSDLRVSATSLFE